MRALDQVSLAGPFDAVLSLVILSHLLTETDVQTAPRQMVDRHSPAGWCSSASATAIAPKGRAQFRHEHPTRRRTRPAHRCGILWSADDPLVAFEVFPQGGPEGWEMRGVSTCATGWRRRK